MPDESTADELTGELLARTSPSLIDPGIAMAAGLAGGDVLSHEFEPDAYANTFDARVAQPVADAEVIRFDGLGPDGAVGRDGDILDRASSTTSRDAAADRAH